MSGNLKIPTLDEIRMFHELTRRLLTRVDKWASYGTGKRYHALLDSILRDDRSDAYRTFVGDFSAELQEWRDMAYGSELLEFVEITNNGATVHEDIYQLAKKLSDTISQCERRLSVEGAIGDLQTGLRQFCGDHSDLLARANDESAAAKAYVEKCEADRRGQRGQKRGQGKKILPDNDDVTKLAKEITRQRELAAKDGHKAPSNNQIAFEFAGSKAKAGNLLRQLRRYPNLLIQNNSEDTRGQ